MPRSRPFFAWVLENMRLTIARAGDNPSLCKTVMMSCSREKQSGGYIIRIRNTKHFIFGNLEIPASNVVLGKRFVTPVEHGKTCSL